MSANRLKSPEIGKTVLEPFDVNLNDIESVRNARAEYAAIGARLAETTARRNDCWNLLSVPAARPPDEGESGILARTRRLLAGDASAARTFGAEQLSLEHRRLVEEETLLNKAQNQMLNNIDREIRLATQHRKAQPDFEQAREALENAVINLLEVHRAGFELTERVAAKGFELSEATDGWSGAHLPRHVVEILEKIAEGERPIEMNMTRYTVRLINRALTAMRPPDKPSYR